MSTLGTLAAAWPRGTKVEKPGFGYRGEVQGVEHAYRTDWVQVSWDGRLYTVLEYPSSLAKLPSGGAS